MKVQFVSSINETDVHSNAEVVVHSDRRLTVEEKHDVIDKYMKERYGEKYIGRRNNIDIYESGIKNGSYFVEHDVPTDKYIVHKTSPVRSWAMVYTYAVTEVVGSFQTIGDVQQQKTTEAVPIAAEREDYATVAARSPEVIQDLENSPIYQKAQAEASGAPRARRERITPATK